VTWCCSDRAVVARSAQRAHEIAVEFLTRVFHDHFREMDREGGPNGAKMADVGARRVATDPFG
jgi:hypothetical protein